MNTFRIACSVAAAAFLASCAPSRAPRWDEGAETIAPKAEPARGYLAVEEADPLVLARVPRMKAAPFLLYDDRGRFLAKYEDPYLPPVSLPPGRYLLIARVRREERQIQVVVREGRLTEVNLSAPVPPARPVEEPPETSPGVH